MASSTPESNYFISNSTTNPQNDIIYESNLTLPNCTAYGAKSIGIITDTSNTDLALEGNEVLEDIAQRMVMAHEA